MKDIQIFNLADKKEYIEEISELIWKEWGNDYSLKDIVYRTNHSLLKNDIPQMWIAEYNGKLAGVVSLYRNDVSARQDLTPWMTTLLVKKEYRNIGIGKKLQEKSIEEFRKLGYLFCYLVTKHDNYYEKTGWKYLEQVPLSNGEYQRLYQYNLKSSI